jgi:hypothetical protein
VVDCANSDGLLPALINNRMFGQGQEDERIFIFLFRPCVRPAGLIIIPDMVTKGRDNSTLTLNVEQGVTTADGAKQWLRKNLPPLLIPWFLAHLRHETIPSRTQDTGSSWNRIAGPCFY